VELRETKSLEKTTNTEKEEMGTKLTAALEMMESLKFGMKEGKRPPTSGMNSWE
jgi:hypothetical protein